MYYQILFWESFPEKTLIILSRTMETKLLLTLVFVPGLNAIISNQRENLSNVMNIRGSEDSIRCFLESFGRVWWEKCLWVPLTVFTSGSSRRRSEGMLLMDLADGRRHAETVLVNSAEPTISSWFNCMEAEEKRRVLAAAPTGLAHQQVHELISVNRLEWEGDDHA